MAATNRTDPAGRRDAIAARDRPETHAADAGEERRLGGIPDSDATAARAEPPAKRLPGEMESGMLSGVGDEGDPDTFDGEESDLSPEEARRVLTAPAPGEARKGARARRKEEGHDTESD